MIYHYHNYLFKWVIRDDRLFWEKLSVGWIICHNNHYQKFWFVSKEMLNWSFHWLLLNRFWSNKFIKKLFSILNPLGDVKIKLLQNLKFDYISQFIFHNFTKIFLQTQQVEEIEDASSFSKVFSTVAFIALGAALVAMVLRKQSP